MLDGCWFLKNNAPPCPHHPFCHCTLEPIEYAVVFANASPYSDYGKFDPDLFNTTGTYPHNKEELFKEWGYTIDDAHWLQAEIERQAREKYISGEYQLGKLNDKGQRISIRVTISRRDTENDVFFITGWMVYPNGRIQLQGTVSRLFAQRAEIEGRPTSAVQGSNVRVSVWDACAKLGGKA